MYVYNNRTGDSYEVYPSVGGGGGGGDAFASLIMRILAFIIIIGIVVNVLNGFKTMLVNAGILRTTLIVSWDMPDDSDIKREDVSIALVSMDETEGGYEESIYTFKSNKDTCKIRPLKGTYTIYYEYGDVKYSLYNLNANGFGKYQGHIEDIGYYLIHVVEITFRNNEGEILYPEQLSLVSDDGEELSADLMDNGKYAVVLDNGCGEVNWTINAAGYEPKEITFNGDTSRVFDVEVVLDEN